MTSPLSFESNYRRPVPESIRPITGPVRVHLPYPHHYDVSVLHFRDETDGEGTYSRCHLPSPKWEIQTLPVSTSPHLHGSNGPPCTPRCLSRTRDLTSSLRPDVRWTGSDGINGKRSPLSGDL